MFAAKQSASFVIGWVAVATIAACSGGGASRGEHCDTVADCADGLQCLDHICKPECKAAIECGDGMVCTSGSCVMINSELGDPCEAELDCGPGQTCRLAGGLESSEGYCREETLAGPPGSACAVESDCRSGTCALGRCTELCARDDQCRRAYQCTGIPIIDPGGRTSSDNFRGCLPAQATVSFEIPVDPVSQDVHLAIPVPTTARSMVVVAEVAGNQEVGVTAVWKPGHAQVFTEQVGEAQYYAADLRHKRLPNVAVLQIPSTSKVPLVAGGWEVEIGVFGELPTKPRVRVIEKLGDGATLDVHFYFLDLDDHPCGAPVGVLNAADAPLDPTFQTEFIGELRNIFGSDIALGEITYTDLRNHPELDGLAVARAGELFELTTATTGVSVFFVRSLSPAGLAIAVGGNPGSPLPGTRASGIAVSAAALCYTPWDRLARQTAHGIARHMGLYRNTEPGGGGYADPLDDSPLTDDNLMYWSDVPGTALSREQRNVLLASPVLR